MRLPSRILLLVGQREAPDDLHFTPTPIFFFNYCVVLGLWAKGQERGWHFEVLCMHGFSGFWFCEGERQGEEWSVHGLCSDHRFLSQ